MESYERELKKKMQEVEKAVQVAFKELYQHGKFKESDQPKEQESKLSDKSKESKLSNSSLSNSSDMTIQSVQLKSKVKISPQK